LTKYFAQVLILYIYWHCTKTNFRKILVGENE